MTTPTQESQKEVQDSQDTSSENLVKLRRKLEATEAREKAAQAKAVAYEKEIAELNKKRFREPEPIDDDVSDEPYVDEKRLNKKLERFEERFGKRVDEIADQKARAMLEQERNNNFLKQNPDFAQVLSPEIIEKFAQKYPEVAEPMLEMPEGFSRQKLLYQNIKALGLHKAPEPKPSIQQTIDQNRKGLFYQPGGVGSAPYAGGGDFSDTGQKTAYQKVQELKSRLRI